MVAFEYFQCDLVFDISNKFFLDLERDSAS